MKLFAKIVLALLALLNGVVILHYGMHAIVKGKFYGTGHLAMWSDLIDPLKIDPLAVGIVFVIYGFTWLFFGVGVTLGERWAWWGAFITAAASMWFIPLGTAASGLYLIFLTLFRKDLLGKRE